MNILILMVLSNPLLLADSTIEKERVLFKNINITELDLISTQGNFALLQYLQTKQIIKVGDFLSSRDHQVLAISKNQVFFKRKNGFGLFEVDGNGVSKILYYEKNHADLRIFEQLKNLMDNH